MLNKYRIMPPSGRSLFTANRHGLGSHRRFTLIISSFIGVIAVGLLCALGLAVTASKISEELRAATGLVANLKSEISSDRARDAVVTARQIRMHTSAASAAVKQPLWTLASTLPVVGPNLSAVSELSRSADDVASLGLVPLVKVFETLDWEGLIPSSNGSNLEPLKAASPDVASAAYAVRLSADRLDQIATSNLLPQVAEPLEDAKEHLKSVTGALDAASDASNIMPSMLGSDGERQYLLMVQNNAESRASGGIPGALAVLTLDMGRLTLGAQSSAAAVGVMSPTVSFDRQQQQIYSHRVGKYMQDVNMTPDFPTAAVTARTMWERKTGQHLDGVISVDPVALAYILDATGPLRSTNPELTALAGSVLPTEFTGQNIVQTLLSDVYAHIEDPALQDAYFAGVAQEIFAALSNGEGNVNGLIEGLTRGSSEGRILVWSGLPAEQHVISKYNIGGSITGPSVSPAEFGVYFNDGTGAKMDYYVKRTVQLIKECPRDGYEQTTVRITHTNTAPEDAATSLPAYVTGNGAFGVPPGSVETNIVAYGPVQAAVETAKLDGQQVGFAPYLHANRPVGVVAIRLAPGETRTVDMTFGRIVQHTEPNIVVTPTVQAVNDVVLPTSSASCG